MDDNLEKILGERQYRIVTLRESEGKTFRQIGGIIGVCEQRASQIYRRAKRTLAAHEQYGSPYLGLSTRLANICFHANLRTREEIQAAIIDGRLHPNIPRVRRFGSRGCGRKGYLELHKWLGLQEPKLPEKRLRVCPHCGGQL